MGYGADAVVRTPIRGPATATGFTAHRGNNPSEYDAVDAAALGARLHDVASPCFDVEGLRSLRTNLLVAYEAGGAGKSTLLREIESALTAREGSANGRRRPSAGKHPHRGFRLRALSSTAYP
ncbi:hypothetical protein [Streptomyces vinaceus]|uniref:hypothetical protein n=1 Tax=Streptomyces vinaceus TaxID=1960 RepID=UPI0038030306